MDYIAKILEEEFSFYKKLSSVEKSRFAFRVQAFIQNKSIEGRHGFVVDERVEVLISATSVQLTFGLNEYLLDYFDQILIYPKKYYSDYNKSYHVGEANAAGQVVFSWEDFYLGIVVDNDSKNVGLHEFAHSLMLSDAMHKQVDSYFSMYFNEWKNAAINYLEGHTKGRGFFRDYAFTNLHEFFAVGVEYFFEKTSEFRAHEPALFGHFCKLLNQIPDKPIKHVYSFKGEEDYSLKQGEWKFVKTSESRSALITGSVVALLFLFFVGYIGNEVGRNILWFLGVVYFVGFLFYMIKYPIKETRLSYFRDRVVISEGLEFTKEILFSSLSGIEFIEEDVNEDRMESYVIFYYKNNETYTTIKFKETTIVDMGILNYLYNKLGIFVLLNQNVEIAKINNS